jgi:uncharacterized lipoprotein YbaY
MQRAAIWAVLSVGAMALLAGCAGDTAVKLSAPLSVLPIKGALTYHEQMTLPPDSVAVVELREAASVEAVAAQRIPLAGKQLPIPFELSANRAALAAGKSYSVRGAIEQAGQVAWVSAAMAIDPQQAAVDLGVLNMQAVQGGEPVAATWRCGKRLISTEQIGGKLRLTLGETHYNMRQVEAASGIQYAALDDLTTTLWLKAERAMLTVKGKPYPECVGSTP